MKFLLAEALAGMEFVAPQVSAAASQYEQKYQLILKRFQKRFRVPVLSAVFSDGNKSLPYCDGATEQTVFPLASVTKVFTATYMLILAERHKLSLKDSICKYFEQLPDSFEKISLLNLITHTSGLALSGGNAQHRAAYLSSLSNRGLRFIPGEKMEYNNPAYVLLGWIAEKITGQSLSEGVDREIFQPLDMKNTSFPKNGFTAYEPGYKRIKNQLVPASTDLEFQTMGGTAGAVSCVSDMTLFASGLLSNKLLDTSSLSRMFEPMTLNSGRLSGTAFCWQIGKDYESKVFHKNGNIEGFSTWFAIDPINKASLVVLSNLGGLSFEDISREAFNLT
ncbi:MAG: beta-lactamase family protein [Candidatus Obscuribacterales bacterium]|nr:beta-lactamase family protein [Candidatus Obscuribacterales bacterium]